MIRVLLFLLVCNTSVIAQQQANSYLTIGQWKYILKNKLKVNDHSCFEISLEQDSIAIPRIWCYEKGDTIRYQYYNFTGYNKYMFVTSHPAQQGAYLLYFDEKQNIKWCQKNCKADSAGIIKYTPEIYAVQLYGYDDLNKRNTCRYILFNTTSGKLLNYTIETFGNSLLYGGLNSFDDILMLKLGSEIIKVDYIEMELLANPSTYIGATFTQTYYSSMKKVKGY